MITSINQLRSVSKAVDEAAGPPQVTQDDGGVGAANWLRLNLAVRGWVAPARLLEHSQAAEHMPRVLGQLARDVETAVQTRPGQWYLSVAARRQELARHSAAALLEAAQVRFVGDEEDPVRQAMQLALSGDQPALSAVGTPLLTSLGSVCEWLDARTPYRMPQIAGELASRTLDADLARMTKLPLVGEQHRQTLNRLREFACSPRQVALEVVYIYGGGGAGKTTLLAFLQRALRECAPPLNVARIDFDDPAIDPTRMVTLNLALFEQLARSVPDIRDSVALSLPFLRQIALVQRNADPARQRGRKRKGNIHAAATMAAETVVSQAASDEGSVLHGLLDWDRIKGPLLIILDTAELVLAQSDRIAAGIVGWLDFLKREAGARVLRLVIAGRDPPAGHGGQESGLAARDLVTRLEKTGASIAAPIGLSELNPLEAAELLRNCGLTDEKTVTEAAQAVPGNPLLLRITGDALSQGDATLRESVRQAHRDSRIDPASARDYLSRRIVAHVSDPLARPYVLAAAYSPVITWQLLAEVVIPVVDRHSSQGRDRPPMRADAQESTTAAATRKAKRVFKAFAATYWLTRPTLDTATVPFNREIRAFALKLLAAAPESAVLERDLRQSAAIFHLRRKSAQDRALALYHVALTGQPYRLPRDRDGTRELLRDVLEELPPQLGQWLVEVPQESVVVAKNNAAPRTLPQQGGTRSLSESEWRRYLEGDSKRNGEGAEMVRDDRAREALELYRSRPTRPEGRPPTFVIQAQADLGEWDRRHVDVEAILKEESDAWLASKKLSTETLSRIYWLTRFALLEKAGRLSRLHIDLLKKICPIVRGAGALMLPPLLAVAEAVSGALIMDERMYSLALQTEAAGRVVLIKHSQLKFRLGPVRVFDGQLAVTQRDWWARIAGVSNEAFWLGTDAARLQHLQGRMDRLHARPIARVNQLFDKLRDQGQIRPDALSMQGAVLLLRGMTTEFHRPLREALLAVSNDGHAGALTRSLLDPILEKMSIRPLELHPQNFYQRLEKNPQAWYSAFIAYTDRCRLLPSLCERLRTVTDDGNKLKRVVTSFLAWDKALSGGIASGWQQRFL